LSFSILLKNFRPLQKNPAFEMAIWLHAKCANIEKISKNWLVVKLPVKVRVRATLNFRFFYFLFFIFYWKKIEKKIPYYCTSAKCQTALHKAETFYNALVHHKLRLTNLVKLWNFIVYLYRIVSWRTLLVPTSILIL